MSQSLFKVEKEDLDKKMAIHDFYFKLQELKLRKGVMSVATDKALVLLDTAIRCAKEVVLASLNDSMNSDQLKPLQAKAEQARDEFFAEMGYN